MNEYIDRDAFRARREVFDVRDRLDITRDDGSVARAYDQNQYVSILLDATATILDCVKAGFDRERGELRRYELVSEVSLDRIAYVSSDLAQVVQRGA